MVSSLGGILRAVGESRRATGPSRGSLPIVLLAWAGGCVVGLGGCARAPAGPAGRADLPRATVPVVITPPRPFRTASLDAAPDASPADVTARTIADGRERLAEPRRLDVALPQRGTSALPRAASRPAAAAIALMLRDYARAFDRHDAVALAAHWSDTAENVDLDSGDVTRGRDAVRAVFTDLFHADPSGRLDIDIESIRLLRDDVAVVDAVSAVTFAGTGHGRIAETSRRRLSAVVVCRDDRWLLESVRETPLADAPGPVPAVGAAREATRTAVPLGALAWLVGEWEGTTARATVRTTAEWVADGKFLVRNHLVAAHDGSGAAPDDPHAIPPLLLPGSAGTREVSEVIGYDGDRDQIRSWFFNSQGRFAEGTWAREGDRWVVTVEGAGTDVGATARCTVERIGVGACASRCDGEALADVCPPACDLVRVD